MLTNYFFSESRRKKYRSKRSSYSPVVFKQGCSLETYLELWRKKAVFHIYLVSFYFIFSAPISFSLCFPVSPTLLLFFFDVLSQVFTKCSRKAFVHTYINSMHDIYIYIYIYILEKKKIYRKLMKNMNSHFTQMAFNTISHIVIKMWNKSSTQR